MKTILVTGANGQLGQCFKKHSGSFPEFKFHFCNSQELDITSEKALRSFFRDENIDICINTAAYTNVELAESEKEKAFLVNAESVAGLARICKENDTELVHFSTDYVFDGSSKNAYLETDEVNPINVYGASKLKGEENIQNILKEYYIFRTSWLYSNANDLAFYVLEILKRESKAYGLYHFSNLGQATWFEFAELILIESGKIDEVNLNKTGFYKTLAERPENSVLSKEKTQQTFGPILTWQDSLKRLIRELDNK
jgi:dTDP-4-dehydrorhamnose reductase